MQLTSGALSSAQVVQRCLKIVARIDDTLVNLDVHDAASALGYEISNYATEAEFLIAIQDRPPDILLLPLAGDAIDSIHLQRQFRDAGNPVCVIFIAEEPAVRTIVKALELGAVTVLPPRFTPGELIHALADAGARFKARRDWINATIDARERMAALSDRQREVMQLVVAGTSSRDIAAQLDIAEKTVEKHRQLIYRRTEAANLTELVRLSLTAERSLDMAYSLTARDAATSSEGSPDRSEAWQ